MSAQLEAGYIAILGEALRAGHEATQGWDPNDWFPCGSGSVLVKPRNSKFAKWLIANGNDFTEASMVRIHDADYKKAVIIRTNRFNQAMSPQCAWAAAVAEVLRAYDIKADMWSYVD